MLPPPSHRPARLALLVFVLLLVLSAAPPLLDIEAPFGFAAGAQTQRDPTRCDAVGSNWTSCDQAFSSDDAYAFANATPGPSQLARPDLDIFNSNWVDSDGNDIHFEELDETLPDDNTTYTQSPLDPGNADDAEFGLSDVVDPQVSSGHVLRYRFRNSGNSMGNAELDVTVELRDGASIIGSWTHLDLTDTSFATHVRNLTAPQADAIANYTDLRVRFNVTFDPRIVGNRQLRVTWAEFEVPGLPIPGQNDTAWRDFGFALNASDTVETVEVGVEWFRLSSGPILNVTVSWNAGSSWATNQTATNKSLDDDLVEWLNFTSATAWDASSLSDANLRVRVGTNTSGSRLDYVTVRSSFTPNAVPQLSNFRVEDPGGVSWAGELLQVDARYYFIFNVTDTDGWSDVGDNGFVALRLWYDGNVSPEFTFAEQTGGASYRIEVRYQDLTDPGNASLGEWSVGQGLATYNATASSLTEIWSGPTLIGYEFRLAVRLGADVKHGTDPGNSALGSYNDPDSWNAEVTAGDGWVTGLLRTASTGEHMEFGIAADPVLSYAASAAPPSIEPGQTTTFRVTFTNEGKGDAAFVWVNVTLPPELRRLSDDAALIGGVRSGAYSYEFAGMIPAPYAFNLTVAANGGVADGTSTNTRFVFEAQDLLGETLNAASRDVTVTISSAVIELTLTPTGTFLDPGDTHAYSLSVRNVGAGAAQNLLIEATVDDNVTFSSSPAGTYNALDRTISWVEPSLGPGGQVVLAWTVEVNLDANDLASVVSRARVDFEDGNGTALPPVETSAQSAVRVPGFLPVLLVDRVEAERRDEVVVTVHYNNTGSGMARYAWLNWTLGGAFELVSLTPPLPSTSTVVGFNLALTNVTSGSHVVTARLRVIRGLQDGLPMQLRVDWAATDGNGNPLPGDGMLATITLLAPSLGVSLEASPSPVDSGTTFRINASIANVGRGAATGWLNLTLPAGFRYVADNGTLPVELAEGRVGWRLEDLPPDGRIYLGIELQAIGGARVESLRLSLEYTDGRGSLPVTAFSNALTVQVLGGSSTIGPWWWLALALAAAGAVLAFLLLRRHLRSFRIEEVFVMDGKGVLISHLSRTLTPDKDSDLLASMLKTLQDFIGDAFSTHEEAPMRRVEFGEHTILMERGLHHWVAIVYLGEGNSSLEARLKRLSEEIDLQFGEVLESWSGEMSQVRGIRPLLRHLWVDEGGYREALGGLVGRLRTIWPGGEGEEEEGGAEAEAEEASPGEEILRR